MVAKRFDALSIWTGNWHQVTRKILDNKTYKLVTSRIDAVSNRCRKTVRCKKFSCLDFLVNLIFCFYEISATNV